MAHGLRKIGPGSAGRTKLHRRQDSLQDEKTARFIRELVASTPSQRNYKGILIALLVICGVCGLIVLAIYLQRPPDDGLRVKGRKITLSDLSSQRFLVRPFNGSWITENEIIFQDRLDQLVILDGGTLARRLFLPSNILTRLKAKKFQISKDQQFALFTHDIKPNSTSPSKKSFLAKYTAYEIDKQVEWPLRLPSPEQGLNKSTQPDLQYAEWTPQNQGLIFIYKNDIYYKESPKKETCRLTDTGEEGVIYNGIPDWLYEMEILKQAKAFWVSPDGKTLVYASFNDSLVGIAPFPWYTGDSPYSEMKSLRYPKAGTTNPEVNLWIINLDSPNEIRPISVQPPPGIHSRENYMSTVDWIDENQISVVWLNRDQNIAAFGICGKSEDWKCKSIYILKPPEIGWLDFPPPPIFSKTKRQCLLKIPWRDGEAGYFHHIIWLDIDSGREFPITSGPFEVTEISAWDQLHQIIYFIGAPQGRPGERHLYSVLQKSFNSSIVQYPICLTCEAHVPPPVEVDLSQNDSEDNSPLTTPEPTYDFCLDTIPPCLYNRVRFSPENEYFIRECLGPEIPFVTLHKTSPHEPIKILEGNYALRDEMEGIAIPLIKMARVQTSLGWAQVKLHLPPGFRENEDFKFPFLLQLNGAPGTQSVSEKWEISWASYLSSQKNFVVGEIDVVGSGFQGEKQRQQVHKNLGTLQVPDQLEVVRFLIENENFSYYIDEGNMALMGKGYGGFLTLLTLTKEESSIFQCGIALSPITKWEFYDTAFTERYLGSPNFTENYHGYEDGDLIRIANELGGKKILIVHGTADESVHYQHTLYLTKELIRQGLTFSEQIYPDEGHDFSGVTEHLFTTVETFLDNSCFEKPDWKDWEKANFLGIPM